MINNVIGILTTTVIHSIIASVVYVLASLFSKNKSIKFIISVIISALILILGILNSLGSPALISSMIGLFVFVGMMLVVFMNFIKK